MNQVVLLYEVAVGQNKLHSVHKSEESAWIEKRYEEYIKYNRNLFSLKLKKCWIVVKIWKLKKIGANLYSSFLFLIKQKQRFLEGEF